MSDETRRELESAQHRLREAATQAARARRDALATTAAQMPERAQKFAKRSAKDQPEVTRRLGSNGVASLRADVAKYADELGSFLRASETRIEWPKPSSSWNPVAPHHVESAIAKVLRNQMATYDDLMESKGYARPGASPQYFYDSELFEELADALTEVYEAEVGVLKARKADDDSAVEDLWGD